MAIKAKDARGLQARSGLSQDEMREIAVEALIFAYPLVIMEMTRRAQTNVEEATTTGLAPMNQFSHFARFPDASFATIVRRNVDTLYSTLWFDVSREPLVVNVADSGGRYYLLELIDMWTDAFDSIGPRTTGGGGQRFALVSPSWNGRPPAGGAVVRSPTSVGWILGRTQTNGPGDYAAVHQFQRGITARPLSSATSSAIYDAPCGQTHDEWVGNLPPVEQVEHMNAEAFLATFASASRGNPPHANDNPILHRMRRIGLEPGKTFSIGEISVELRRAIAEAWPEALARIKAMVPRIGIDSNGWRLNLTSVGTYGTSYLQRAAIAYAGLGANTIEDAVYPSAFTDSDGQVLSSDERYVLHFAKDELPPARAFWSLTLYDARHLLAANPIDRYALGDRDDLQFNPDGSLDVYVQRSSPGAETQANWLPTPASGSFSVQLRLYWPMIAVTDGAWSPPPLRRVT